MDDLDALIARLEKATKPSRALDMEIAKATGWKVFRGRWLNEHGETCRNVWEFTASIDAAMHLVPEGYHWEVTGAGYARVRKCWDEIKDFEGRAKNPAIALTIAALKARNQSNG